MSDLVERLRSGEDGLELAAAEEIEEMNALFDLQWKAEMRGIKKWQEETGRSLIWPDKAEFTLWLLNKAFPTNVSSKEG